MEAYYSQKREAWMTMSMMDDEVRYIINLLMEYSDIICINAI